MSEFNLNFFFNFSVLHSYIFLATKHKNQIYQLHSQSFFHFLTLSWQTKTKAQIKLKIQM